MPVKYSPEGSEIIVTVEDLGEKAVVNVRDFGKGIPEEDQPKLFHSDTHFTTYGHAQRGGIRARLAAVQGLRPQEQRRFVVLFESGRRINFQFFRSHPDRAAAMNASADSATHRPVYK